MRYLAFLLLSSCASTTVYEDGKKVFTTQADIDGLNFSTGRTTLTAARINHSLPTRAGGSVIGTAGVAVATSGILTVIK